MKRRNGGVAVPAGAAAPPPAAFVAARPPRAAEDRDGERRVGAERQAPRADERHVGPARQRVEHVEEDERRERHRRVVPRRDLARRVEFQFVRKDRERARRHEHRGAQDAPRHLVGDDGLGPFPRRLALDGLVAGFDAQGLGGRPVHDDVDPEHLRARGRSGGAVATRRGATPRRACMGFKGGGRPRTLAPATIPKAASDVDSWNVRKFRMLWKMALPSSTAWTCATALGESKIQWGRVAATPRLRRGYSVETSRGDAAATPRRRRGYSVETSRGAAAAATRIFRESRRRRGRDADIPWRRVAATPRPRRGYSASRGDAAARATELGETKTVFAASGLPASSLLEGPRPRGDADDARELVVRQHDVRGFLRDVGARHSHGDADVRGL